MELYQLRPKTLEMVELLRKNGGIGPLNYERGNGKTTALLIRAKELMDKDTATQVVIAYHHPRMAKNKFTALFPHAVNLPFFTNRPFGAGQKGIRILIDEPYLLKWTNADWDEQHYQHKVETVGRSF